MNPYEFPSDDHSAGIPPYLRDDRLTPEYGGPPPWAWEPPVPSHHGRTHIERGNSGLAVAAMVLGICGVIVSWFTFGIPSLLALIFGIVGLRQTGAGKLNGRGFAITGTVLGAIMLLLGAYVSAVLIYAVGTASTTDLDQIDTSQFETP